MQRFIKCCLLAALACGIPGIGEAQTSTPKPVPAKDTATAQTAQKTVPPRRPKRPKPISRESSIGLRLRTDGWSLFFDKGYVKSEDRFSDLFYDIRLFWVELGEVKHTKQIKRSNTGVTTPGDQATPFVYGKTNNFYTFKLGYGFRKMIAGKPEPGTVSIHLVYGGGISLGLLKPYYINALVTKNGITSEQSITYSDSTKEAFLSKPNIIGSSGFSKGLGEIKLVPGVHAKLGLHFDIATDKKGKLAIETGMGLDYYAKEVELMAVVKPTAFLANFYASVQIGRRK